MSVILKVIGGLAVMGASSVWGMLLANRPKFRLSDLREMEKALSLLRSEIDFGVNALPEALWNVARRTGGAVSELFGAVSNRLLERGGEAASSVWESELRKVGRRAYFSAEDIERLIGFGGVLGYLDKKQQINAINMTLEYISSNFESLMERSERARRLYGTLGVLGGLAVLIVII